MSTWIAPAWLDIHSEFRRHGGHSQSAGIRIAFRQDDKPGIHFRAAVNDEYRGAILKGLQDGMDSRFPEFLKTGAIWINQVNEHAVDSSKWAFYAIARCAIEQAYTLVQLKDVEF